MANVEPDSYYEARGFHRDPKKGGMWVSKQDDDQTASRNETTQRTERPMTDAEYFAEEDAQELRHMNRYRTPETGLYFRDNKGVVHLVETTPSAAPSAALAPQPTIDKEMFDAMSEAAFPTRGAATGRGANAQASADIDRLVKTGRLSQAQADEALARGASGTPPMKADAQTEADLARLRDRGIISDVTFNEARTVQRK